MTLPDPNEFLRKNNPNFNLDFDPTEGIPDINNVEGPDPADYRRVAPQPENLLPQSPFNSTEAIQGSIAEMRNFFQGSVVDPYQMGKTQPFGAGIRHHQYERYYEHPKFNTLGFTPFRDNETFYNENSSGFDDFQRTVGEWGTLSWLGMKDAFGFGSLTDVENAKTYERAMAIGQSSRGGVTGFANNLFLNSGYTAGIMAEMALEELGLALVTAATVGGSSPVTVPLMGARAARATGKIYGAWKMGKNILKALDNLKDINRARVYMRNATRAAGRILNPLEQTTDFVKGFKKLDNLSKMAKTTVGVGSFYRDVRNLRLVFGESGLEGGMVQNQMEEQLLAAHYAKFNRAPTDEEAKNIKDTSHSAGMSTALWNMPTIFLSNKIVFDNMFKAFSPIRRLTTDVITKNAAGKIVKTGLKDTPFQVIESNFKGFIKNLKNPKTYARNGLNYFKANFAEGLQETSQEIISGTAIDYYTNNMNSAARGGIYSYIGDNIQKQMSHEGAEVFLSGFLMGGMIQPVTKAMGSAKTGFSRLRNPEQYQKMKAARAEYLNNTVNTLNEMYQDPLKYFAPDMENLSAQQSYQKGMSESADNGDTRTHQDLKDGSVFQHIATALRMGRMDTFYERLEDLKNLNEEEIREAFPTVEPKEFAGKINAAIERAKGIEKRFNAVQTKFPNPFNPSQHKYGTPEYTKEALNYMAYEKATENAVFMQHSFDRTLERMTSIQREAKEESGLAKVPTHDFNALFTIEDTEFEIKQLQKELKALEGEMLDSEARKFKTQKEQKLKYLQEFAAAMDEYLVLGEEVSQEERDEVNAAVDGKTRPVEYVSKKERTKLKAVHKAYHNYLKHLAKVNGDHAFDSSLNDSFQKLIDFYNLNDDTQKLTEAVNTLTNPDGFIAHSERLAEVMNHLHNNRKAHIAETLKKYMNQKDQNELMIKLHEAGMFFDSDQLNALLEKGELPAKFYYASEKNGNAKLDEVVTTSADFKEAMDIVSDYVEHIINKPVPERSKFEGYETESRKPVEGDNRTYADYAEQFGFDSKAAETKVPLKQVLQSIIDSEQATEQERILARRLISIAKDTEVVTFKNNMEIPSMYTVVSQTTVDPRYASSDFEGQSTPLETVILHAEVTRRLQESASKNTQFKKDMTALWQHVNEHFKNNPQETRPPFGLSNLQNFIAEAMTNPNFQAMLAGIDYKAKNARGANSWKGFIDAVVNALKAAFGKDSSNTALNAAIDIVTLELDEQYGGSSVMAAQSKTDPSARMGIEKARTKELNAEPNLDDSNNATQRKVAKNPEDQAKLEALKQERSDMRQEDGSIPKDKMDRFKAIQRELDSLTEIESEEERDARLENKSAYDVIFATLKGVATLPGKAIGAVTRVLENEGYTPEQINEILSLDRDAAALKAKFKEFRDARVNAKYDVQLRNLKQEGTSTQPTGRTKVKAEKVIGIINKTKLSPEEQALKDELIAAYKNFNAKKESRGEPVSDPTYKQKSDDELVKDKRFIAYATSPVFKGVQDAIKKYNEATGRTEKPSVAQKADTKPADVPKFITREMKSTLTDRGFSKEDIKAMSVVQAVKLIDSGITKAQIDAAQEADTAAIREELEAQRDEVRNEIDDVLDEVENLQDLEMAEQLILGIVSDNAKFKASGYTTEEITAMIEAKKNDIAFTVIFEDLREGEVVIMNDKTQTRMVVAKKTNKQVQLHKVGDVTFTRKVNKKNVTKNIKYRYSPAMEQTNMPTEEVSPSEKELLNEDIKDAQTLNNQDSIQEDIQRARNKSEEEVDEDFLDGIDNCKN